MNVETPPATFSEYWARTREQIDAALKQRIPEFFAADPGFGLEAVIRAVDGGKRIRGCLVCLICNVLGGSTGTALSRAVAIECVQAASLIHDDYIDGDSSRRNRPAGWLIDGSRRAVLVGDVMFSTVIEQMAANGAEEGALIARTIAAMARGAYLEQTDDNALEKTRSRQRYETMAARYDEIIRLKTAVLFAAAAKFGAIAAEASENLRRNCFDFGMRLGEAYQLADDLADLIALQCRSQLDPAQFLGIAPMMIRFSNARSRGLEGLSSGDLDAFGEWVRSEVLAVRFRVTQSIADLQRKSVSLLAGLPENRFRSILCEMPAEVTKAAR